MIWNHQEPNFLSFTRSNHLYFHLSCYWNLAKPHCWKSLLRRDCLWFYYNFCLVLYLFTCVFWRSRRTTLCHLFLFVFLLWKSLWSWRIFCYLQNIFRLKSMPPGLLCCSNCFLWYRPLQLQWGQFFPVFFRCWLSEPICFILLCLPFFLDNYYYYFIFIFCL